MNLFFSSLFILLMHFLTLFWFALPTSVDQVALLAIKSQITHDPHKVLHSWNDSFAVCKWQGVTCGTKPPRRVVALDLSSNDLVGTLSPYVGNLSFLHHIELGNNTFGGQIPSQIGHLTRLRSLSLVNNSFGGEIPANLSRCLNLKELRLGGNHLSGTIPSQLSLLSKVEVLTLSYNRLIGDLLNKVVLNMTSLQVMHASGNSFAGSIPDNIGSALKNLVSFSLGNNNISGIIPPSFYNLSSLQDVNLGYNQLQGTLPLDFGFRFPQLTELYICSNFFHGSLPASLSNLTQLEALIVYSNNFTGKFMLSARNMPNLILLDVSLNYLGKGEADDLNFLQNLANCSLLQELLCGANNFGGILPDSFGNLSSLTALDFAFNKISGGISSGLFNLINLRFLRFRGNQLTGHLSPEIGKLTNLESFDCDDNYLSGNLPNSFGNLSHLSVLYLSINRFHGTIPSSLGECTNLLYLSLPQNNLSGALPPQLFHSSSMLVRLRLDHNHLEGIIPSEIGQLSNLVLLEISENGFSGELPSTLSSCTSLVELHMGGNAFIGSIPQSFKSLTSLNLWNLSHNKLSGTIPYFLSKFPMMLLDLSFNNFEGEVPRTGVFANVSALTLLGNSKLCGGIPELHLPICPPNSTLKGKKAKLSVAVTVIVAVACLVVAVSIVSVVYFLVCFRRKQNKSSQEESPLNLKEPFSKVSYDKLMKATDRFSEANLLGSGQFGSVYKGVLDDPENNAVVVAVKVIKLEQRGAIKSFISECEALRNIRHRNLLQIVTVCSSTDFQGNDFKALVYEFMPNGSLHQWIHTEQHVRTRTLSLLQRVNIAIDVASALDYLHNSCDVPVIHCDLKPSNILLDNHMVAHLGDFGLARFHLHATANNSSSLAVKGTVGYAAPEYGLGNMVTKEGDIYSYGIVLIEMITAKNPINTAFQEGLDLHSYAKSALLSDQLITIIDPKLLDDCVGSSNGGEDEVLAENKRIIKCTRSLIEIGVRCSVESPEDRMRMEDAIRELQATRDVLLKKLHIIHAEQF